MDDDVVPYLRGKKEELVVEVQVTFLGTTAPASFLILYVYLIEGVAVDLVEVLHTLAHDLVCLGLVFQIIFVTVSSHRLPLELLEVRNL